FIDNKSIFDTSEMEEGSRFLWAYQIANAFHFQTREDFLSRELLFETGDCFDPFLLEETERILRAYPFIARADVFDIPQSDGTRHVVVDTQDEWTLKLDVGVTFDDGLNLEGISLTEENFLGRGVLLGMFYHERKERKDLGIVLETPRLVDSRLNGRVAFGQTRTGIFFEEGLAYPFVGETGRYSAFHRFRRRESLFPYVAWQHPDFSQVGLPFLEQDVAFAVAGRVGRPGNLTLFGVGFSWESLDFNGFPGSLESYRDGDFSDPGAADQAAVDLIAPQAEDRSITRASFLLGQRNVRYVQRSGLDALQGIQDVRLGSEVTVTLGRSLGIFKNGQEEQEDDLYTRVTIFAGLAPGNWIISSNFRVEGRQVFAGGGGKGGWHDAFGEGDVYAYWQPPRWDEHTIFTRVSGAGGWSVHVPFQLTLGGRDAVRGYREEDYPGGRRLLVTVEDRIRVSWPAPELFDFGLSLFADAGRVWSSDVPYGTNSGWRSSVGMGLRIGFPPGSRNVLRLDLALPIERGVGLEDLVFRVSLSEILGLLPGFDDSQLSRSRKAGIGPDIFTIPW
ncbi:MAG: BamA/TamA family outer membrane protein, partial [Gemmatimonadetes bacterium]|nr:BamA/TamA family outer membrane protein [Gemmatimonadota bacterium]